MDKIYHKLSELDQLINELIKLIEDLNKENISLHMEIEEMKDEFNPSNE